MLKKNKLQSAQVHINSNLIEAMKSLRVTGLSLVVVIDDNSKVVGVITDGDVRRSLLQNRNLSGPVRDCMSSHFVSVPKGSRREVVLKLLDSKIKVIPVLDERGCLADIVGSGYQPIQPEAISRARAPARVSLAGGGTDYTNYFMDHGGAGLSCTVAKYAHATLRRRADRKASIYSHDFQQYIQVNDYEELKYNGELDLIKAIIKLLKPNFGFDLEIGCDFPPGSGLGGSAALVAAVIGCFNEFREYRLDRYAIAEHAFEAERIELDISGGWQDQYSTVFGGFNYLQFDREHNVVSPVRMEPGNLYELEERFVLCHTGSKHLGSVIQDGNHSRSTYNTDNQEFGTRMKEITNLMKLSILHAEFDTFGELIDETWQIKKRLNPKVSNSTIDKIYDTAKHAGAIGGRLLGTGGGGYFIFYVPAFGRFRVIEALEATGLKPESITFDDKGLSTWRT